MDKIKILLADDHDMVRMGLKTYLMLEPGFEVIGEAANGREVLERMCAISAESGELPDLILMDVMMPEMNGLEAARCIRAFEGKDAGEGTPIIAMTANVFADDVKSCLDAGMNSHVGKPLDMRLLISEIVKYTRR